MARIKIIWIYLVVTFGPPQLPISGEAVVIVAVRLQSFEPASVFTWGGEAAMRSMVFCALLLSVPINDARAADILDRPNQIVANSFAGFYVAGGGAYGVSNNRQGSGFVAGPSFGNVQSSFGGSVDPAGWSGSLATGINLTFSSLLVGLELDGRFGPEKASKSSSSNLNGFLDTGTGLYSYKFENQGGAHISGRMGAAFADTMAYFKLGVGVSSISETFGADETSASFCAAFANPPPTFQTICVARQGGGAAKVTEHHWRPTFLFGVGAEQNLGKFFARLYGELELTSLQTISVNGIVVGPRTLSGFASQTDLAWTGRAGALVGARF